MTRFQAAVIFDLDGVLTDTAELHYRSWKRLAAQLGLPFDRRANEALRGLSRSESLRLILGPREAQFSPAQQHELTERKNADYLRRLARLSPADLFPGARELIQTLRARKVAVAVASSSRNAGAAVDRLGLRPLLDTLVDGNDISHSKPHPEAFLKAAQRLGVPAQRCVVVEDAASGIAAARAAGMKAVGIGPPERVAGADLLAARTAELTPESLLALLGR